MTTLDPSQLRDIKSFDDVIEYLTDELDWPIGAGDLEEATFDWDPDELGIPAERVPHLASLRQLRPLERAQPWGIFFLEFDGPRLPLTALRRLLDKLVTKKRTSGSGTLRTWKLDDLLFIITTSTGDTVELHFIAFFEQPDKLEIRSIPWRPSQSPAQHLKRLATEFLPHLAWPDDPGAVDEWRAEWRKAFKLPHGEAIASAIRLADRMADTAKGLRREVADALAAEKPNGPFTTLMGEVRDQLVGSVTPASFADMCAQTLVYGVLTSRITDPNSFGASPTLASVPLSNPFLAAFFDNVHDQASVLDLEGIGLEQLVADLRKTEVEAILDQFGASARGGDPVIHFYEEFLQRYDRKMRADAGAFYTPQPVVEFMTRTVDAILAEKFGLTAGVADGVTWADVATRKGFAIPEGVDQDERFVSMVDPATGTGTFVVEWLRRARKSFLKTGRAADWPGHAREVVLPSLHAFELMLGPYAIAHLKVALELHDQGVVDGSPNILLTDTLDHESHSQLLFEDDPVSSEGERAAALKNGARFTVVIGNPPYDREQKGAGSTGKRKGGIARYGVPGVPPLMNAVLDPLTAAGLGKHAKNAYNDYVYFWCWATWQAATKLVGPGVVALITASSYLDGVSLGGLRSHLRDVFDELWIVDLGGEGRGARVDENVFAIRTPVAIAFGIRSGAPRKGCEVRYVAIEGTSEEKLTRLSTLDLTGHPAQAAPGSGMARLIPSSGPSAYSVWPEVTDLFPWSHSGSEVKRNWPIAPTSVTLKKRWSALLDVPPSRRRDLMKETRDRKTTSKVQGLLGSGTLSPISSLKAGSPPEDIERYLFRSLDRQWIIADHRIADYPRPVLWKATSDAQIFVMTLFSSRLGEGPVCIASSEVPDRNAFNNRGTALLPMYRDRRGQDPNITGGLLDVLTMAFGADVEADHLLAYVYGLTATAAFSERFTEELGEAAGPVRIPITADVELFDEVIALGEELLWLHTWGERFGDGDGLPSARAVEIVPVSGAYPERYRWDADSGSLTVGNGSFGPVDRAVWEFEVSGLKVLQSWLGNRMKAGKGKKSSPLDDIRPERWTFTPELLTLLAILELTVDLTPKVADLLERVVSGDLVDPATLPIPTDAERKAPKV